METLPPQLMLPPRTLLADGASAGLLGECAAFGPCGLLVHGRSLEDSGTLQAIRAGRPEGMTLHTWQTPGGEPTLDQLEDLLDVARGIAPGWIAAVGGGSALDIAKACAGLLEASLPVGAYHDGAPIETSRTPFVAVPTTAGTGSEATGVSVLTNLAKGVKKSIRHASFVARLVILDPALLAGAPAAVIASSGMDALTQAVESFLSRNATWFSDQASLKALELIAGSIEAVCGGEDGEPARDLLVGSYLAGVALTNARLGIVHGLAHPLGYRYHVPHGLACAVCLPHALAFNRMDCGDKYDRLAALLGGDPVEAATRLLDSLAIRSPFTGQSIPDRDGIIAETLASGSTAANPRRVTAEDVVELLGRIF